MSEKAPRVDEHGDYIFRFKLNQEILNPVYDNWLVEMVRAQLEDLLNILELTKNGQKIRVDGFRFINDTTKNYCIFRPFEEGNV